jgi:very-short-patch-repair endonuclease
VLRFWGKEIEKNAAGCADVVEAALKEAEEKAKARKGRAKPRTTP